MTNKLRYFVANWKMYGDLKSLKSINKVIKFAKSNKNKRFKVIYCPPYTLLSAFCTKLQNSPLSVGAQNCHEEIDYGAFTGNVNAKIFLRKFSRKVNTKDKYRKNNFIEGEFEDIDDDDDRKI